MVGKQGVLDRFFLSGKGSAGQCDGQNGGGLDRIFPVQLVKVPLTEEEHRVGMLLFQRVELPQHISGVFLFLFLCHKRMDLAFDTLADVLLGRVQLHGTFLRLPVHDLLVFPTVAVGLYQTEVFGMQLVIA